MHPQRFLVAAPGAGRADERRVGAHGRQGIDGGGQLLVVDADERGGVLGDGLGLGDDGGDGLAVEDDAVAGQRGAAAVGRVGRGERQVAAGEDGDDAGTRRRGGGVDGDDSGVGVRAQHEPRVQHARQADVARVADEPGGLRRAVGPGERAADDAERFRRVHAPL